MIAFNSGAAQGRSGVGNVHLSGLDGRKSCILRHKHDGYFLNGRLYAVVVFVSGKDYLLLSPPLNEFVRTGAYGVDTVILAVSVLGNDANRGKGVK